MSKVSKEEKKKTVWLDALVYILLPLVTLIGGVRALSTLVSRNISGQETVYLVLGIAFVILHAATLYYAYKRTKVGYCLIRVLILVTAIRSAVEFGIVQNFNNETNLLLAIMGYFVALSILWIYPNEIYFRARKHLFMNECDCNWLKRFRKA